MKTMKTAKTKTCPNCGTTKGGWGKDKMEFGAASGLCKKCSDDTVRSLFAELGLGPRGGRKR